MMLVDEQFAPEMLVVEEKSVVPRRRRRGRR